MVLCGADGCLHRATWRCGRAWVTLLKHVYIDKKQMMNSAPMQHMFSCSTVLQGRSRRKQEQMGVLIWGSITWIISLNDSLYLFHCIAFQVNNKNTQNLWQWSSIQAISCDKISGTDCYVESFSDLILSVVQHVTAQWEQVNWSRERIDKFWSAWLSRKNLSLTCLT